MVLYDMTQNIDVYAIETHTYVLTLAPLSLQAGAAGRPGAFRRDAEAALRG